MTNATAPEMTQDERTARLAAIHNRHTFYELAIVRGSERYLVCYSQRKSRDGLFDAISGNATRAAWLVAFTGSPEIAFGKRAADGGTMGEWKIDFTGRTERDAILSAELPWFFDATCPVAFPEPAPTRPTQLLMF